LSGFEQWNQKEHAEDWMLLAENFDEQMSIDETMLCDDLFTFFSRKAGKGRQGTLAAVVRGTTADEVVKVLMQVQHPKKYKGKVRGPKPMRKNTRFTPPKIELEVKAKTVYETKVELLTHVRYPLMKSREKWTERQKAEMEILFKLEPRMETAYNLVHRLRCLFKSKITPEKAKPRLHEWCKDVGKSLIRELISVRDTIRRKETEILGYFTNRSTNASAESLNSRIKPRTIATEPK